MSLSRYKFGKHPPKRSMKTLSLGNYMSANKVAFPPVHAWERPIVYGAMLNNDIGDCAIAAPGHIIQNWKAVADAYRPATVTDDQIVSAYSAVTGYDPLRPETDNGSNMLDVLNYWKSTGIAGFKIDGYATIDPQNIDQVKAAIYIFGAVYTGIAVPQSVVNDLSTGLENHHWRYNPSDKTSGSGHAIAHFGYGRAGNTCVSWGELYTFDWDFWLHWVDEAYVVVSNLWLKGSGITPSGLDYQALLADLSMFH